MSAEGCGAKILQITSLCGQRVKAREKGLTGWSRGQGERSVKAGESPLGSLPTHSSFMKQAGVTFFLAGPGLEAEGRETSKKSLCS